MFLKPTKISNPFFYQRLLGNLNRLDSLFVTQSYKLNKKIIIQQGNL